MSLNESIVEAATLTWFGGHGYQAEIPSLFHYNELLGVQARIGSLTASQEWLADSFISESTTAFPTWRFKS